MANLPLDGVPVRPTTNNTATIARDAPTAIMLGHRKRRRRGCLVSCLYSCALNFGSIVASLPENTSLRYCSSFRFITAPSLLVRFDRRRHLLSAVSARAYT